MNAASAVPVSPATPAPSVRWLLLLAVALPLVRFAFDFARGLDFVHVQYLVDDAFYYFEIARHPPEFNAGIANSGFHPLYLGVASIFHAGLGPDAAIWACLGVLALAHSAATWTLFRCSRELFPEPVALIAAAGFATSTRIHTLAMTGVETMLAVALVLIALAGFARALNEPRRDGPQAMAALGLWASVAFLARMDAPLLLAPAVAFLFLEALRGRRYSSAALLAGCASLAPLLWMAAIRSLTGSAIPTSAAALRALRGARPELVGPADAWMNQAGVAVRHLDAYFGPGFGSGWPLALAVAGLALGFVRWAPAPGFGRFAAAVASGFALWTGYYVFGLGGFRIWYGLYGSIFVYAVCVPMLASLALRRLGWWGAGVVAIAVIAFSWFSRGGPIAPHEFDKKQAALIAQPLLQDLPAAARVGSFNTGIYQYYTDVDILNLDGVVNPDAVAAHRNGDIAGYMKRMNVRFLVEQDPRVTATFHRVSRDPALRFSRVREISGAPYAKRVFKRTWLWRVDYVEQAEGAAAPPSARPAHPAPAQ